MRMKPEDIKIVKKIDAPFELYSTMKDISEFYKKVGLLDYTDDQHSIDVQKIHMNDDECQYLKELLFDNNYRKGKFRHYSRDYLRRCANMEWLHYSPCSFILDVPKGEIWLEEGWLKLKNE